MPRAFARLPASAACNHGVFCTAIPRRHCATETPAWPSFAQSSHCAAKTSAAVRNIPLHSIPRRARFDNRAHIFPPPGFPRLTPYLHPSLHAPHSAPRPHATRRTPCSIHLSPHATHHTPCSLHRAPARLCRSLPLCSHAPSPWHALSPPWFVAANQGKKLPRHTPRHVPLRPPRRASLLCEVRGRFLRRRIAQKKRKNGGKNACNLWRPWLQWACRWAEEPQGGKRGLAALHPPAVWGHSAFKLSKKRQPINC